MLKFHIFSLIYLRMGITFLERKLLNKNVRSSVNFLLLQGPIGLNLFLAISKLRTTPPD